MPRSKNKMKNMALKLVGAQETELQSGLFDPRLPDVLAIEADDNTREDILRTASQVGLQAVGVSSFADAKAVLINGSPNVIVTDLNLPDLDAVAAFREMRNLDVTSKIIILSDLDEIIVESAAAAARAHGFETRQSMQKPLPVIRLQTEMLACQDANRKNTENEVIRHLLTDGFLAVYQPTVALQLHKPTGARIEADGSHYELLSLETLARLPDANGNLSTPLAYLGPRNEQFRTGLFTMQMVNRACSELLPILTPYDELKMSFNVVPGDIREILATQSVDSYLASLQIDPSRIVFEITADSDTLATPAYRDMLMELSSRGYLLSFDNVADGFSSYLNMSGIPFHEIKLDRILVQELTKSRRAREVARAVAEVGHDFGSRVTAVGIEDAQTAMVARDVGFDGGQGNYFLQPTNALNLAFS